MATWTPRPCSMGLRKDGRKRKWEKTGSPPSTPRPFPFILWNQHLAFMTSGPLANHGAHFCCHNVLAEVICGQITFTTSISMYFFAFASWPAWVREIIFKSHGLKFLFHLIFIRGEFTSVISLKIIKLGQSSPKESLTRLFKSMPKTPRV